MKAKITSYLDELFPNPVCELKYTKDYELLISIALSAQTTDKGVNKVTEVLYSKYPSIESLSKADIKDIENIIKVIGTYHKKALFVKDISTRLLEDGYSRVPNDRKYLESLNGIGRKSANVFLGEIYNEPCFAVDTHVTRVSKRLNIVDMDNDTLTIEKKLMEYFPKEKWNRLHKQMVLFGRYHCMAIKPKCENCKLRDICNINVK